MGDGDTLCPRNGRARKPSAIDCPYVFLPHLLSCLHCLVSAAEELRERVGVLEDFGFLIARGQGDVL